MNARDDAHRTTVAVTSGLAVAALATTVTVGLVVARSENADAATSSGSSSESTGGSSTDQDSSSSGTTPSDSGSTGSSGSLNMAPGNGSADATSGGS